MYVYRTSTNTMHYMGVQNKVKKPRLFEGNTILPSQHLQWSELKAFDDWFARESKYMGMYYLKYSHGPVRDKLHYAARALSTALVLSVDFKHLLRSSVVHYSEGLCAPPRKVDMPLSELNIITTSGFTDKYPEAWEYFQDLYRVLTQFTNVFNINATPIYRPRSDYQSREEFNASKTIIGMRFNVISRLSNSYGLETAYSFRETGLERSIIDWKAK